MNYLAMGSDISVNHSAVVVLDRSGYVRLVRYLCTKKRNEKKRLGGTRVLTKRGRHKTNEQFQMERLVWLHRYYEQLTDDIADLVDENIAHVYVGLESYAYAAGRGPKGSGVFKSRPYQIGEAAGLFKVVCKELEFEFRLHDPASVKIFATNVGNAPKEQIREAVEEQARAAGLDIDSYPDDEEIWGDVFDAWVLARMVWTEAEVRAGRVTLRELTDGQRRVFLRTTKANPENLLSRPFI